MGANVLPVYKAEVFTNMTKPTKPVSFFMALVDYAPQSTMLFTACVLSLFIVLVCTVLADRFCPLIEYVIDCFYTLQVHFWRKVAVRYVNFVLALTCSCLAGMCAIIGISWWWFFGVLLLQISFIAFTFRSTWAKDNPPSEELEQVYVERARPEPLNPFGERSPSEERSHQALRRPSKPKIY